jgi:hypothetical protein
MEMTGQQGHKDRLDSQEPQVQTETMEQQDRKDYKVSKEIQEQQDLRDPLD